MSFYCLTQFTSLVVECMYNMVIVTYFSLFVSDDTLSQYLCPERQKTLSSEPFPRVCAFITIYSNILLYFLRISEIRYKWQAIEEIGHHPVFWNVYFENSNFLKICAKFNRQLWVFQTHHHHHHHHHAGTNYTLQLSSWQEPLLPEMRQLGFEYRPLDFLLARKQILSVHWRLRKRVNDRRYLNYRNPALVRRRFFHQNM